MEFKRLVEQIIKENTVAGGSASAFGPSVSNSAFSGDNYATGDARVPKGLFSGVMTRSGLYKKRNNKKKTTKKHHKKR
jgi:hypothetical protein